MFNKQIIPQHFAYKLDVSLTPYWPMLAEKIAGSKTSKELDEMFAGRDKDSEGGLYGSYYNFTEYYDTASGLTVRHQTSSIGDKTHSNPVDEFLTYGSMFGHKMGSDVDRIKENKYSIAITEDSIRNNCFDQHIGGFSSIGDKEDYLIIFPLDSIVKFLAEVGLRFHDVENNVVIKWPDHIENELKERGFTYNSRLEYEPTLFDVEKHDKDFYERNGRPKFSLYGGGDPVFECKEAEYRVSFKMFRPKNNDRLGWVD